MGCDWLALTDSYNAQFPQRKINELGDFGTDQGQPYRINLADGDLRQAIQFYPYSGKQEAEPVHPCFMHLSRRVSLTRVAAAAPKVLPHGITFQNVTFEDDVNLDGIASDGPVVFWACTFLGEFSMIAAEVKEGFKVEHRYDGEVNFSYCVFKRRASFQRSVFNGPAYFHRTVFDQGADFEAVRFNRPVTFHGLESDICVPKIDLKSALHKAIEASVASSLPQAEKDQGVADLVEIFLEGVSDVEAAVDNNSIFYALHESASRRKAAEKKAILSESHDSPEFYNFDSNLLTRTMLEQRLNNRFSGPDHSLPNNALRFLQAGVPAVLSAWSERHRRHMFVGPFVDPLVDSSESSGSLAFKQTQDGDDKLYTYFSKAHFAEGSSFVHINLARCFFRQSNVAKVDFVVCEWALERCNRRLPRLPFNATRAAVWDELELVIGEPNKMLPNSSGAYTNEEKRGRRKQLNELYRELRIAYDKEGDALSARDFYFGEMEMNRLLNSGALRLFHASCAYKFLAGYSKQEGLALAWLLGMVLCVFPLAFFSVSVREHSIMHDAVSSANSESRTAAAKKQISREQVSKDRDKVETAIQTQEFLHAQLHTSKDGRFDAAGNAYQTASRNLAALSRVISEHEEAMDLASKKSADADTQLKALKKADEQVWGRVEDTERHAWFSRHGAWDGFFAALSSSLHASAFLATGADTNLVSDAADSVQQKKELLFLEGLRHTIAALERLFVLAQIALLAICLKSRFQRNGV